MGNGERHEMKGTLTLELRAPDGALVERRVARNLITDGGRSLVADLFAGAVGERKLYIAVGTGSAPPAAADSELTSSVRAQATSIAVRNVATVHATFLPTGSGDPVPITEAGIVIEVGQRKALYNRVTFEVVNKAANMQLTLSWEVVF